MKIIKTSQYYNSQAKKWERRFRASIYVDVFVPMTDNLEADREAAEQEVKKYQGSIPNSYIGGVAHYTKNSLNPLDKEI